MILSYISTPNNQILANHHLITGFGSVFEFIDGVVCGYVDVCSLCGIGFQGPHGPAGADGADGTDGQDGADGAVGPQGPIGLTLTLRHNGR